jgi:acyl-coenzyme A synthetase/AMP-(fatty) acid ligase
MGSLDADGRLTVHGRADDMINLNGVNIFPAEIEQVLEAHPAVEAAAALPLASGVHGQIPVAAVELRPGGVASERELVAYAREHLALRAPRRIVILDRLPRNDQGKILRRQIAEQFANGGSMR